MKVKPLPTCANLVLMLSISRKKKHICHKEVWQDKRREQTSFTIILHSLAFDEYFPLIRHKEASSLGKNSVSVAIDWLEFRRGKLAYFDTVNCTSDNRVSVGHR